MNPSTAPADDLDAKDKPDGSGSVPEVMHRTGQTERYVLQSAALRRRQLRAAFLYGSRRSWRQRQNLWPAGLIGGITIVVIVAVIAVMGAFEKQQRIQEQEKQQQQVPAATKSK